MDLRPLLGAAAMPVGGDGAAVPPAPFAHLRYPGPLLSMVPTGSARAQLAQEHGHNNRGLQGWAPFVGGAWPAATSPLLLLSLYGLL